MVEMRFPDSTALCDPVRVASLAVSLLQSEAYQPLLLLSSKFVKDRHRLLDGSPFADPVELFQWQKDNARELLQLWDAAKDMPPDTPVYYRVWDCETVHACVPFARDRWSGRAGLVVLCRVENKWLFHNLLETPAGLEAYCQDWSKSMEEAVDAVGRQNESLVVKDVCDDEKEYWESYDLVMDDKPVDATQASGSDQVDSDDDYWAAYDKAMS
ncbi:uncharacterized protein SPPG_04230 [Spizellomyces punctatus DAOM BR117]|uniref:Uncharacterized protein n=1 Tax=Spizellomyces punctatus (strain DAOM BR117) TaxID=645134 RepID=A0A0L0HJZ2_SPIPD|nr:uncharacterized protein SPPG_04230 [Spizellomyces punctatus DAOM BR117]KND01139.1 hypothetical protein SPPG_04230 [Spizellomyces punctatus DAOM BR117]|eukprot:XP_016609178.1 hypothetical protein SPPG_04230 [Spizellomyces punctatus DAOM BR117]